MFFCWQLQVLVSFVLVLFAVSLKGLDEFKMHLLWLSMVCLVLFMQLWQVLIVLRLKILLSLWSFEKVLAFYGKESVSDIGADIFAELGVAPEYVVPLTVFSFVSYGWFIM